MESTCSSDVVIVSVSLIVHEYRPRETIQITSGPLNNNPANRLKSG